MLIGHGFPKGTPYAARGEDRALTLPALTMRSQSKWLRPMLQAREIVLGDDVHGHLGHHRWEFMELAEGFDLCQQVAGIAETQGAADLDKVPLEKVLKRFFFEFQFELAAPMLE